MIVGVCIHCISVGMCVRECVLLSVCVCWSGFASACVCVLGVCVCTCSAYTIHYCILPLMPPGKTDRITRGMIQCIYMYIQYV